MLDVNAGIPLADEPRILAECVKLVQDTVDVPLSIDSSIVAALEAGLAVYKGKPLVNSVTGEEERLEVVLPLVKKYNAAVIAISNDETGISEDPDVRYAVAKKIVERAADFGIPREDVVVDPLVMPVGAINDAGARLMYLIRRLRDELKVNTSCGASNFSFGLPNRRGLNAGFLPMMIGAGMTSAIMNPLHPEDRQAILGADVVMGHDPNCTSWIKAYREPPAEGEGGRGREGRRRARVAPDRRTGLFSRHRASAATSKTARACWRRRASSASISIQRLRRPRHLRALPGRRAGGRVSQASGSSSAQDHVTAFGAVEAALFRQARRLRRGPAARLSGAGSAAISSSTCRPRVQVHRQVVRKRAETHPIEVDPVVRLYYVEVAEPDMHDPSSDLRRLQIALHAQWGVEDAHASLAVLRGLQKTLRKGEWKVTAAVRKRARDRRALSRLHRARLRRRGRYRLDHDRRASLRSRQRRRRRLGRPDEPADPLRRGSDEPRLLCDDEPRRRRGTDARRARGGRRADRRGRGGGEGRARRSAGGDDRRQPDHAPSVSRPRSDRARRRAVRADGRRRHGRLREPTAASRSRPAATSTPCPASPAMSAPTPPASRSPRRLI